ncbi:MAG: cation:proton antiporter [Oscillospiraceae bacterium]|nr:cation:proton antiporter [Oscillospiraceae bacterium]
MNELLFFAICFVALALVLFYRLIKGPSVVDRAVTADSIEILTDMALILFALHSGRSIYLDIALVTAVLGFIGSVLVSRYLEGRL